jgi:phage shock protein A
MAFGYVVLCVLVLVVIPLITYVSFLLRRIVTLSESFLLRRIVTLSESNAELEATNENLHIQNDTFAEVNEEQQITIEWSKNTIIALTNANFSAHNTIVDDNDLYEQLREKIKELNEKIKELEQNEQLKEQNHEDVGSKKRKV